jgi:serine/threonine protein kinase
MASEPTTEELAFRRVTGEPARTVVTVEAGPPTRVGEFLIARRVWREDRTELRQLRVLPTQDRSGGYGRLDNEILAGRRLHEVTEDVGYPPVLSHLYGDEADSADPYALIEPYRGEPLHAVVSQLMRGEQQAFEISLLTGLCWLEAAGLAHRGLSPSTVRWDARQRQAQITDFSLATVFGVPREPIGPADWVAPEQRPGVKAGGLVAARDDMHAVGRLIYYVRSQGEQLQNVSQLTGEAFEDLIPFFGPPNGRPTARALLARRPEVGDPIPRGFSRDARLKGGYERFDFWRQDKHPGISGPLAVSEVAADAAESAPDRVAADRRRPESGPAGPAGSAGSAGSEAARPWELADQGKRSWWRRGGRS